MGKITDDTTKLLRQVWLHAASQPNGFVLECGDKSSALYYRMRLYRVAKAARDRPHTDPELAEALSFLSIATPTDGKLHIAPMIKKGLLASIAEQIGYNPRSEAEEAQKQQVEELERRLGKALGAAEQGPGAGVGSNPYNTRG